MGPSNPECDIFLSYAREDRPRAAEFARAFEVRGWTVFWDVRIAPGERFASVIGQAILKAKCVVVLWSQHSARSEWVTAEADDARQRNVLVPALIERGARPPLEFRRTQTADLVDWTSEMAEHPGFADLLRGVTRLAGSRPGPGPSQVSSGVPVSAMTPSAGRDDPSDPGTSAPRPVPAEVRPDATERPEVTGRARGTGWWWVAALAVCFAGGGGYLLSRRPPAQVATPTEEPPARAEPPPPQALLSLLGKLATDCLAVGPGARGLASLEVLDDGLPGGPRAAWMAKAVKAAAGDRSVDEGGDPAPDARLLALSLTSGPPAQLAWTCRRPGMAPDSGAAAVTLPEVPAPRAFRFTRKGDGLRLSLSGLQAGQACTGQKARLLLHADREVDALVFDFPGEGRAILAFPSPQHPSPRLKPGERVDLGEVVAVAAEGNPQEGFVALGTAPGSQLPLRWRGLHEGCQVPDAEVAAIEADVVATTGYRLRGDCPPSNGSIEQEYAAMLARVPGCKVAPR